jgi:hypothetical protein
MRLHDDAFWLQPLRDWKPREVLRDRSLNDRTCVGGTREADSMCASFGSIHWSNLQRVRFWRALPCAREPVRNSKVHD